MGVRVRQGQGRAYLVRQGTCLASWCSKAQKYGPFLPITIRSYCYHLRMSKPINRPKQPEIVKSLLLDAGAQLLANGEHLSIGGIAEIAGVSKGAVQHHFPSREDLVLALYEELLTEFKKDVAGDGGASTAAWRYAQTALHPHDEASAERAKALLVAAVVEKPVAGMWAEWLRKDRAQDGADIQKLMARLAADGLWLSDLLNVYQLSDDERAGLAKAIEQLAKGS